MRLAGSLVGLGGEMRVVIVHDGSACLEPCAIEALRSVLGNIRVIGASGDLSRLAASGIASVVEGDVMLVDARVELIPGWVERMCRVASSRPGVGVVVPFSSGAGICGVPLAQQLGREDGPWAALFGVAAAEANAGVCCELPVAAGRCMLITRRCLDLLDSPGVFVLDEISGEIALAGVVEAGFAALLVCDLFAYCHVEPPLPAIASGRVHGSGWDDGRIDASGESVLARRVALSIAALRALGLPVVLHVHHGIGGGVERHVRELANVTRHRIHSIFMRPGACSGGVCISLGDERWAEALEFVLPRDSEVLLAFLRQLGVGGVHIHHTLGFPEGVWGCLQALGDYDVTLHDYVIVCGSPTLTDGAGRYIGAGRPVAEYEMAREEQALCLQRLAHSASRCIVPSEDMRARLQQSLPSLRCERHPHPDREVFGAYPAPWLPSLAPDEPLRVLCLGALGREKGALVLRDAARLAARRCLLLRFTLLGSSHVPLGREVSLSGRYSDAELAGLLELHRPHLLWFPAQWPETWSYTLSAGLEAGVPVLASAIGAFPERLEGRPLTWLLSHDASVEEWVSKLLSIRQVFVARSPSAECEWRQADVEAFYRCDYMAGVHRESLGVSEGFSVAVWQAHGLPLYAPGKPAGWRTRLLRLVLKGRGWRLVNMVLGCVPYNWQRRIKRFLSTGPLE